MIEKKTLKKQKSYPYNNRRKSNFYLNNDNFINKITNTQNNFYLTGHYNNLIENDLNIKDDYDYNYNNNEPIHHIYKSYDTNNNTHYNFNIEEKLKRENRYIFDKLNDLKEELNIKEQEIEGYKNKIISLLNNIKNKNNIINDKNYFITKLIEENDNNRNNTEKNINNILRLSNSRLKNYMNKNSELKNTISEQRRYILSERKKFMNCISKIKVNFNQIKEDSKNKDKKIKTLYNLFMKEKKK